MADHTSMACFLWGALRAFLAGWPSLLGFSRGLVSSAAAGGRSGGVSAIDHNSTRLLRCSTAAAAPPGVPLPAPMATDRHAGRYRAHASPAARTSARSRAVGQPPPGPAPRGAHCTQHAARMQRSAAPGGMGGGHAPARGAGLRCMCAVCAACCVQCASRGAGPGGRGGDTHQRVAQGCAACVQCVPRAACSVPHEG